MEKLTGSEKQITWAEDIRASYAHSVKQLTGLAGKLTAGERLDPTETGLVELVGASIAYLASDSALGKAGEWIDSKQDEIRAVEGKAGSRIKAEVAYIEAVESAFERAVDTETEAKFWIDNRR